MRCPKCQYISFDSSDRCRNCGYEFAFAVDEKNLDLPIRTGDEAIGPLSDFSLEQHSSPPPSSPRPPAASSDLPLFRERTADGDTPLVAPVAVPRAPLSVRRSSPVVPRPHARVQPEEPELDLGAPTPIEPAPAARRAEAIVESPNAAPAGWRILAAVVDGVILGTIWMVVLYLTLRVCGLGLAAIAVIPLAPFVSFLLLIAGGYFTVFIAANGQTIGKMAAGLKVVPADADTSRVSVGHAVLRAAAYLVSALPAGLGFLPALVGDDRRAIHDRLAATRVVKA
jgi:uncharacterized RDD family membrane protein YckC